VVGWLRRFGVLFLWVGRWGVLGGGVMGVVCVCDWLDCWAGSTFVFGRYPSRKKKTKLYTRRRKLVRKQNTK
jgi:hypothetical protein